MRGLGAAYQIAENLLRRAHQARNPSALVYAHHALGETHFYAGNFVAAREHLVLSIFLYDAERHRPLSAQYALDAGVYALTFAAATLWHLGYPDQALQKMNEGVALAQWLSDPFSLAFAQLGMGVVRQLRREAFAVQERSETLMSLCAEHGLIQYSYYRNFLGGWALAEQGHNEEGIALIEEGLASSVIGDKLNRSYFLVLLAESCRKTSRVKDGLRALGEASAVADEQEVHFADAEIHRMKGELLLEQDSSSVTEARICFQQAIEVARQQSTKSLELRATTSLARLLALQDRRDEARTILAEIYSWFTEGFDTADLKDAKALLEELT